MTLLEIKNWIATLPPGFDEFETVVSEIYEGDENCYRLDKPLISLEVDTNSKEVCFVIKVEQIPDEKI